MWRYRLPEVEVALGELAGVEEIFLFKLQFPWELSFELIMTHLHN